MGVDLNLRNFGILGDRKNGRVCVFVSVCVCVSSVCKGDEEEPSSAHLFVVEPKLHQFLENGVEEKGWDMGRTGHGTFWAY